MLYDPISVEQIVDAQCAHEFLKEATRLASSDELEDCARRLERKSERFVRAWGPDAVARADASTLTQTFELIFSIRRKAPWIVQRMGADRLLAAIRALLHGDAPVAVRFQAFVAMLEPVVGDRRAAALGSELLFFTRPAEYWLWTHWLWDPATRGGALPLVLSDGADLSGASIGETYEKVGAAIRSIDRAGRAEGFTAIGHGVFGTYVFTSAVYSVYMYTVFRMKLSKEFNRILPELPELTRRMLGVHNLRSD